MRFHGTLSARSLLKDQFVEIIPDLVVTTYEAFTAEQVFFKNKRTWGLCVLDEGHRIKNSGSNIAAAVQGVRARMRIILSGTPLQNNLVERELFLVSSPNSDRD
jgi:SWI/SNF-related matrix-associated actin-dependent regulator of chromatin subfamily A member 5